MPQHQNLKALRINRNVTVREVEAESRKIAEARSEKRFYISNARLTQLENDPTSEPGLWKLISLSEIYQVSITELMRFYNVDLDEIDKYSTIATPSETCLLSNVPPVYPTKEFVKNVVRQPEKTTLLPQARGHKTQAANLDPGDQVLSYGYIGLDDFTMYPLIRPGSLVSLDPNQRKARPTVWRTEYERPIYFLEHRRGYACGWCELQGKHLLLIPHHSSHASVQRFVYPNEVEIVGRVVRISTSCVDDDSEKSHVANT